MFILLACEQGGNLEAWRDHTIVERNREQPRAAFKTTYQQSLNGDWLFHFSTSPSKRPVNFYKRDYDTSDWASIPVPANWERHGYGHAIYTNHTMPFTPYIDAEYEPVEGPALVPVKDNPVGSYRRDFTLDDDWAQRRTYIEFGGVSSAFYLWVNGEKVGYSEGSKTAVEFDITDYVKAGNNTLALEVYRWSSATYLEAQDFWWHQPRCHPAISASNAYSGFFYPQQNGE